MAKPDTTADQMARDAAKRIDEARAAKEQLTFLPDEAAPGDSAAKVRGKGKAASQLRDWLAARGMAMPEDQLAAMAGLASRDDLFTFAMAQAERVLIWAQDGATGYKGAPTAPSMGQRVATFQFVYTAALRAAEALLPYGLAKITPDVAVTQAVQVVLMPSGPSAGQPTGPESARDVTPKPSRMAPPPMPGQIEQNQSLTDRAFAPSDASDRTK